DGPDLKVQRAGHENVAISEIACRVDESLRLRKNRRLERDFKKIVRKANQAIAMHPPISSKRKDVEQGARIQIEAEKQRNAQQNLRELINTLQHGTVVTRVIRMHRHEIAGQQRAVEIIEGGLVHKAADIITERQHRIRSACRRTLWRSSILKLAKVM